jgi:hypothetical protein
MLLIHRHLLTHVVGGCVRDCVQDMIEHVTTNSEFLDIFFEANEEQGRFICPECREKE